MAAAVRRNYLPDPAQAAGAVGTGGADDLLAKLAGEEIDRLLAEAAGTGGATAASAAPTVAVPDAVDVPDADEADEASVVAAAAEVAAAETEAVTGQPVPPVSNASASAATTGAASTARVATLLSPDDPLHGQLDALFEDLAKGDGGAAAQAAAPAAEVRGEDEAVGVADEDVDAEAAAGTVADGAMSAIERDLLAAGVDEEAAAADVAPADRARRTRELPAFVLKPLVWANAPFGFLPDSVRSALGKVGIVTLVNAIALLAYVTFFRKH